MTAFTSDELRRIERAEEVEIAVRRKDGTLDRPVTVWIVRSGDDLYVRSAVKGRNAAWFRAAQESDEGRISAEGIEKDVRFEDADLAINNQVDAAYRSKYGRYAGRILNSCLTPEAKATTLRIVPH